MVFITTPLLSKVKTAANLTVLVLPSNVNYNDVDHVVALKDAHLTGGKGWSPAQKSTLKSAFKPLKFITKLRHSGYRFAHGRCVDYINLYIKVKRKYSFSLASNRVDAAKLACQ